VNLAGHIAYFQRTSPATREAGRLPYLERFARQYPGMLLVEYPYLAVIASQPPAVLDVVHYRLMVESGIVSADPLVEQLERRSFEYLILRDQLPERYDATQFMRWPEPVWMALKKNYRLAMAVDGQFVYALREARE
jgi:hypothetical protein